MVEKHLCIKEGSKLKSTQIWSLFKKDNDQLCKTDLDVSSFKEMLYLIVSEDKLVKAKEKEERLTYWIYHGVKMNRIKNKMKLMM